MQNAFMQLRFPALALRLVRGLSAILSPAGSRARLLILIYHRILRSPDPMQPDEPDAEAFTWQMRLLAEHFTVLPLAEAVERLQHSALPARAASVTFDDGYADNVEVALPILQRWGLPATFFVATGYLDGGRMWNDTVTETVRQATGPVLDLSDLGLNKFPITGWDERRICVARLLRQLKYLPQEVREQQVHNMAQRVGVALPDDLMMSTDQVRDLARAGMEIGAHTMTHPILATLDEAHAKAEIVEGRGQLQEITGSPIRAFAYPNGKPGQDYHGRHVRLVRQLGFQTAVSTAWGTAGRDSDIYQLPRFTPWDRLPARFALRLLRNYFYRQPPCL